MNTDEEYTHIILGYFSGEGSQSTFRDSNLLSNEEFLEFQESRDKIAEFYRDILWFNPVIENYNKFCKTVQDVQEKFSKNKRPDYSGTEIIDINSFFNNYAASITSYLNYMEKRLKNRNGEMYWERFYRHTSEQYDQNISYRFLYGLRNYIQHQSPPIHINYKAYFENTHPVHRVKIYCSKEELLKNEKWNKVQREDILKMDDKIDISLHVDEMMGSLNQILISHLQDEFLYLQESAMYVHALLQKIPEGRDQGVYEIHFSKGKIVRMTPHLMYTNIVKAIIENDVNKILHVN